MKAKVKKKFDCLEMKRIAQDKVQAQMKGMNFDEQLAFWAERHRELIEKKRLMVANR